MLLFCLDMFFAVRRSLTGRRHLYINSSKWTQHRAFLDNLPFIGLWSGSQFRIIYSELWVSKIDVKLQLKVRVYDIQLFLRKLVQRSHTGNKVFYECKQALRIRMSTIELVVLINSPRNLQTSEYTKLWILQVIFSSEKYFFHRIQSMVHGYL